MSNPEKSQEGQFPPPPPAKEEIPPPTTGLLPEQTHYPPPPPGPPPSSSQQQAQSFPPPPSSSYPSEKQQPQQDFPPPPPGPPPYEAHDAPQERPQEKAQHFPPPPPGPPPAQGSHPDPLHANPVQQDKPQDKPVDKTADKPAAVPAVQNYTIPQYNPAAPVFAAPPTNQVQTEPTGTTQTPTPTPVDEQPHKKHGWSERFSQLGLKAAAPINMLAHKLGSQSFLPETLDKECDKAAAILTTFCKKGAYADPSSGQPPTSVDPKATETTDKIIDPTKEKPKNRVIVTIPPKVISKAVGLAIFTTLRAGFNVTGATGSGILIARLPDGSWGPPSGIQVHTVGGGFSIGLDIFDCVCVINSREALAAFTNTRVSLGSDLAVVAGPYGAGGVVEVGAAMDNKDGSKKDPKKEPMKEPQNKETEVPADQNLRPDKADKKSHRRSLSSSFRPVFSYVKSRGFYAGIQIDGTVVVERKDANAAFYGSRVSVAQILKGDVPHGAGLWPSGARGLLETLRGIDAGAVTKEGVESAPVPPAVSSSSAPAPTSAPAPAAASGSGTEQPPAYVDDGVQRPGVGDHKYQYQ